VRFGGDTKTAKSRLTLGLPRAVVEALREHRVRQDEDRLAAGELWRDHGLVFTTAVGTELDAAYVRRSFRSVCRAAGIGEGWAPRELRTSFVSLLSASGVPVEEIARLAGHSSSLTTEVIYRKELRPVLVKGAEVPLTDPRQSRQCRQVLVPRICRGVHQAQVRAFAGSPVRTRSRRSMTQALPSPPPRKPVTVGLTSRCTWAMLRS
jgi:hypothetical protein